MSEEKSWRPVPIGVAPFGTVYGYYNISRRENFLSEEKSWRRGADRPTTHRNPISLTGASRVHRGGARGASTAHSTGEVRMENASPLRASMRRDRTGLRSDRPATLKTCLAASTSSPTAPSHAPYPRACTPAWCMACRPACSKRRGGAERRKGIGVRGALSVPTASRGAGGRGRAGSLQDLYVAAMGETGVGKRGRNGVRVEVMAYLPNHAPPPTLAPSWAVLACLLSSSAVHLRAAEATRDGDGVQQPAAQCSGLTEGGCAGLSSRSRRGTSAERRARKAVGVARRARRSLATHAETRSGCTSSPGVPWAEEAFFPE